MVLSAKQRSLYELTDAISACDRARALALLHGLLNSSDAGEDSPSATCTCWRGPSGRCW